MILHHASQYDNAESIMEYGLYPTDGGARLISPSRDTLQGKIMGVYGFVTLDDAINFAGDNGGDGVVFSFEADDDCTINDPEYDGEAKIYLTTTPVPARLVWQQWE